MLPRPCRACIDYQRCRFLYIKVGSKGIFDEQVSEGGKRDHIQSTSFLVRHLRGSLMMAKSLMNLDK